LAGLQRALGQEAAHHTDSSVHAALARPGRADTAIRYDACHRTIGAVLGVIMTVEEQRMYDDWLRRARPLLEAGQWGEAMRDVPRLTLEPAVPRPLTKPLADATIALVTSAALSMPDQPPMDGPNIEGDYTIRVLDVDADPQSLLISHTHFDISTAQADVNVVYPIDRLKELAAEGVIGKVAPQAVSFMGYFSNVFRIRDEVVPVVVETLKAAGADGAILVPV
jgi:D-proline reductase (dithiol) PrdB